MWLMNDLDLRMFRDCEVEHVPQEAGKPSASPQSMLAMGELREGWGGAW